MMGYPYGPEPYPTWGMLERDGTFRSTLYESHTRHVDALMHDKAESFRSRPVTININAQVDDHDGEWLDELLESLHSPSEEMLEPTDRENAEAWGMALADAIVASGIEGAGIDRLFNDLTAMIEDHVVGDINRKARESESNPMNGSGKE